MPLSRLAPPARHCYHPAVRWRIAIAVLAVLGIVGAVYLSTQPKKGTVEWHKREYFSTLERVYGQRLIDRVRQATYRKTGWAWVRPTQMLDQREQLRAKIESHRTALVASGYIVEHTFPLTNVSAFKDTVLAKRPNQGGAWKRDMRPFLTCVIKLSHEGSVSVIGPPEDMGFWQNAIRQADVPKTK
jgi:hypothetical protein